MEQANKKIIVFGGTGYYGRKVVEKLLEKNISIRVVSRNALAAGKIVGKNVEIFEGDVTVRQTIIDSLRGVSGIVICLSAMNKKQIKLEWQIEYDAVISILEEAAKYGIQRLVYMSGYEMREDVLKNLGIPEFGEIKIAIENKIKQSDFNWTILGDAPAFELFFALLKNDRLIIPGGGWRAVPTISADDVGEITAQAVLRDDLGKLRLRLTGPEAFNFQDAAGLFSKITGKRVKHFPVPLFLFGLVSILTYPFNPFLRYIYKSLLMLNNFPEALALMVPEDHKKLRELFNYEPVTLEMEIRRKLKENKL